jgi:hypothetical protein
MHYFWFWYGLYQLQIYENRPKILSVGEFNIHLSNLKTCLSIIYIRKKSLNP